MLYGKLLSKIKNKENKRVNVNVTSEFLNRNEYWYRNVEIHTLYQTRYVYMYIVICKKTAEY